jgi:hypothetical protein
MNLKERAIPIGKEQWDAFLAAVARNTVRRDRGEQSRAPSPTCEACQGTGWVTPWFDDLGRVKMRVRCGCTEAESGLNYGLSWVLNDSAKIC